jgi:sugar phosphate isomerase/epimerase
MVQVSPESFPHAPGRPAAIMTRPITRRRFQQSVAAILAAGITGGRTDADEASGFRLNYIVASAMYGKQPLAEIVPEVRKSGAGHIEIWAEPHGNQREQIDELGVPATRALLEKHDVRLGSFTCFKYGIFNMQDEMDLARELGGDMVICNTPKPPAGLADNMEAAVADLAEKLKPHVEAAEHKGITIGVENHGGGAINTPESIRLLMDAIDSRRLGLAMAPYHLPQDTDVIAQLIRDLGPRLVHFQAWEHGDGCMQKLPKEQELKQLPHRGPLDWTPLLAALKDIDYPGRTQIFMHPVPRGIPILPTTDEVTAEINAARAHLEERLRAV